MANLMTRDDTLLGICEGWGEDLGVNANYLRVALAALVLWDPLVMIGLYAAMGLTLALTRWALPTRQVDEPCPTEAAAEPQEEAPLPLAA